MKKYSIEELRVMRESEDHVEFKSGEGGNISYNGANKQTPKDRRRCIIGYVVALCNEGGGRLVIGMHDKYPHKVTGTKQAENGIGQLESNIYRDLKIRTDIYELFEEQTNNRVLVIEVPPRPIGKLYKFEDVPLMRVGEDLQPMDDKTYLSIIQEQEPDFSQQICMEATFNDLDPIAIGVLKEKYARKQGNKSFMSLSDYQALSDLHLTDGEKITNAAVLLVGKEEFLNKTFPQAKVMLEYRNTEAQINFDNRQQFSQPFFLLIDKLWEAINSRNGNVPIREGAYIFDIPYFNEDVIREVVDNAFAHRDYRKASEIVIKQYPTKLAVTNAGGFPNGVNLDNILTVPSTPRNRLLADILSKTGIVERSGQGIDKIFHYTLSEGKPTPDYTESDDFNVTVILSAMVKDKAFAMYIQKAQAELPDNNKLSVFDILTLCEIRDGAKVPSNKRNAIRLRNMGLLEKKGKTRATYYILPRTYYELLGDMSMYSNAMDWNIDQFTNVIIPYLEKYGTAKRAELNKIVGSHISDKMMRTYIERLRELHIIDKRGQTSGLEYFLTDNYKSQMDVIRKALNIGLNKMKEDGEI